MGSIGPQWYNLHGMFLVDRGLSDFSHFFALFGRVQQIICDDIVQTVQLVCQLAVAQPQTI